MGIVINSEGIQVKRCPKCEQEKTFDHFCKCSSRNDGLYALCKECKYEYDHKYMAEHREQNKEYAKIWYNANKEYCKMRGKKNYEEHKEQRNEYCKIYRDTHKEQLKRSQRDYYVKNRERLLQQQREWKQNNSELVKEQKKLYHSSMSGKAALTRGRHKRRTSIESVKNDLTAEQWEEIKRSQSYKCAYCGKEVPLHRDHIIPVTKGGGLTKENVQGLCQSCNSKKRTKIDSLGFMKILSGDI